MERKKFTHTIYSIPIQVYETRHFAALWLSFAKLEYTEAIVISYVYALWQPVWLQPQDVLQHYD